MGPLLQPPEFPEATLCFPQAVIGIGSFAGYEGFPRLTPEDVQGARGYVGAALGLEDRAERDGRAMRVALLTRGGTRRFLNEEAIAGALGARGFPGRVVSVLHNNAASFREQLLSLWDADLVISPHGAQLSYAWFVSRLALVEVIPFGHNIVLTKLAAQSAGQPYVRMGLTRQQSVLDVGALSPEARDDLERLRAENATLHDQLLREFRCPPGGWRLACSLILDRDLAVDTDRLVWVADTLAQLGRFLVPE